MVINLHHIFTSCSWKNTNSKCFINIWQSRFRLYKISKLGFGKVGWLFHAEGVNSVEA